MNDFIDSFKEKVGGEILENETLANHCAFRIGGKARYFFIAKNIKKITKSIELAQKCNIPIFILSGGSNILFSDDGYDGLVLKIKNEEIDIDGNKVIVGAGVSLGKLVAESAKNSLSGLSWAAGIPGSVGGAVRGNAGAYGHFIGESIDKIEALRITDEKVEVIKYTKEDCKFAYRESIFKKNKDIILKVFLALEKGEEKILKEEMDNIVKTRGDKLPLNYPSAGCIFKNIKLTDEILDNLKNQNMDLPEQFIEFKKIPAAWLIDKVGLKGKELGGVKVSEKHANFIVNTDNGKAKDVIGLIQSIKSKINEMFGVSLEEEIEIVD